MVFNQSAPKALIAREGGPLGSRLKKMPPSDVGLVSPGYLALDVLQRIVRNPPISQSQHSLLSTEAQTKIWNEWIAAHQVELEKLEPIGDGVDFSDKACKNGKPVKKP